MSNDSTLNLDSECPDRCIVLLKKGDERAFAQFVNTYQDMVFACCRSAGLSEKDMEDAASETFLAAYQSIRGFSGKSKLSSWLWTIAYRKALKIRGQKRVSENLNGDIAKDLAVCSAESADLQSQTREQSDVIWDAVQQLPEKWAAAVVLFYREDKPVAEIAEILGIPANTIKTYLDRGRKKLYDTLGQFWEYNYVKS